MSVSGVVKKGVSSLDGRNDSLFYPPFFLGWTRFPVNANERRKGTKCPTGKGFRQIAEPTRTGANEVIRHIVMWKLKETAEGATRAQNALKLKDKLEACRGIVPGLLHLEVGLATPGLEATYDVVLVSDFADKAALDAYQVHPVHEDVKKFVSAVRQSRECIDYLVDDAR